MHRIIAPASRPALLGFVDKWRSDSENKNLNITQYCSVFGKGMNCSVFNIIKKY